MEVRCPEGWSFWFGVQVYVQPQIRRHPVVRKRSSVGSQEHTNDGVCSGYGDPVPILEGKFERNMLSFLFDRGELPGSVPFTWIETKEAFRGTSEGTKIRLVRQHDHNRQPWNSQSRTLPNWRMIWPNRYVVLGEGLSRLLDLQSERRAAQPYGDPRPFMPAQPPIS